jgi:predicted dehydrogenase
MPKRLRYAQVGLGIRSWIFSTAIAGRYRETSDLVGLCDDNPGRLNQRLSWAKSQEIGARGYPAEKFEQMVAECRPDCVIVTPPDRDHASYICRALELG